VTKLRLHAGVDEAGLGPLLGPMTFGYSVFRAPCGADELWRVLAPAVSDEPGADGRCFVVADSKLVFKRTARCHRRLESTALGFLALKAPLRRPHTDARRYLFDNPRELALDAASVDLHPWYRVGALPLPRHVDAGLLELRVEDLHRALVRASVDVLDLGVRVVPEAELNRSFGETDNKARTHWLQSRLIFRRIWQQHAQEGVELWVDRHGGRMHYGSMLAIDFPEASVELVDESSELSRYRLTERRGGARRMEVAFAERAESRSLPVALASCLAKYARELAMECFNAYWIRLDPSLTPTAGYTEDGRRWLADAKRVLEQEKIDRALLVRSR